MKRSILRIAAGLVPAFLCLLAAVDAPAQTANVVGKTALRAGAGTGKDLSVHETVEACAKAPTVAGSYVCVTTVTVPTPTKPPEVAWVECSIERAAAGCQFTGTRAVRFGTSPTIAGRYFEKTVSGPTPCTNVVFGDPVVGVEKKCWTTGMLNTAPAVETPPATTTPTPTPPTTTPPASAAGGVPKREDFAGFPVVGQITATPGQVIERVRITTTSGPCVIVAVPNVTIRDALIGPCGAGESGKGIDGRSGLASLTVLRTWIEDVSTAVYIHGGRHPIIFDRSVCTKIRGPYPRGQCVQFNGVTGTDTSKITCNVSDVWGLPDAFRMVEDHFNFYSTSNVEMAHNRIRGGGYKGTAAGKNPSGTAILFGDAQGGTNLWAHHNDIINVTNVGIGIAGGDGVRAESNRVFMDGPTSGNYTNVGIYASKQGTTYCRNARLNDNQIYVRKNDGSANPRWIDLATCPGTTESGNKLQDTSLSAAIFDEVPAPCR